MIVIPSKSPLWRHGEFWNIYRPISDEGNILFLRFYTLLYAHCTIIMTESSQGIQNALTHSTPKLDWVTSFPRRELSSNRHGISVIYHIAMLFTYWQHCRFDSLSNVWHLRIIKLSHKHEIPHNGSKVIVLDDLVGKMRRISRHSTHKWP